MYKIKKQTVWASDVAEYLNAALNGKDILLHDPRMIRTFTVNQQFKNNYTKSDEWLLLSTDKNPSNADCYIVTSNPDRDLALVLREFFATPSSEGIHPLSVVAPDAIIGRNVRIGAFTIIEAGVEIGDFAWIMSHAVIHSQAKIGKSCVIKDGAIIGSEGYGFVKDENGVQIHPPQLGRVLIGDNVWVGAHATVERGMLVDTVIEDGVKIDDLVHIGNGACIRRNALITAGSVLAYNVEIGENVVLAPSVSVREGCSIVAGAIIGQSAAVVESINIPGVYVGVPAKKISGVL